MLPQPGQINCLGFPHLEHEDAISLRSLNSSERPLDNLRQEQELQFKMKLGTKYKSKQPTSVLF